MIKAEDNINLKSEKDLYDIASNTAQYFWHTQTGTDTGVHITEVPKDDFLADPANGGGNLLARSNGIALRDGLTELAKFEQTGVTIGLDTDYHAKLNSDSFYIASGYENLFAVDKSDRTKTIVSVDVERQGRAVSADTAQRSGSFIARLDTAYLISLNSSDHSTTYDSSVDGTNTTKTVSYERNNYRNDVTLVFSPAVDSAGTACVLCEWTQVFTRTSGVSGGFATFLVTHEAVIVAPKMNFEGDVRINGWLNVEDGYEELFKVTQVRQVLTGGCGANSSISPIDIPMTAVDGYNAVGIVGHSSNYARVQPATNYVVDNEHLHAGFYNPTSTGVSSDVTVIFYVLWLKATALP